MPLSSYEKDLAKTASFGSSVSEQRAAAAALSDLQYQTPDGEEPVEYIPPVPVKKVPKISASKEKDMRPAWEQEDRPPTWEEAGAIGDSTVEPSLYEKIQYGFASMDGLTTNAANFMERQLPLGRMEIKEGTAWSWRYVPPDPKLVKAIDDSKAMVTAIDKEQRPPTWEEADVIDGALSLQNRIRDEKLTKEFPEIHNTKYAQDGAVLIGALGSALADPTTVLIPFSGGVKAVMGTGAALGAADTTAYQLATKGSVDLEDVAIAAAIGGVAAGLIQAGGRAFTKWLAGRKAEGIPISKAEIIEKQIEYKVAEGDPSKLADAINDSLGINRKEVNSRNVRKAAMQDALKDDPEMTSFFDKYARTQDDLRDIAQQQAVKAKPSSVNAELRAEFKAIEQVKQKQAEIDAMFEQRARQGRVETQILVNKFDAEARLRKGAVTPLEDSDITRQLKREVAKKQQTLGEFKGMLKQSGGIDQKLLQNMGSTLGGAGLGYVWEGKEGAMVGAAIGLGLPWALGKSYTALGKMSTWAEDTIIKNAASIATQPRMKFQHLGNTGKVFSARLTAAIDNAELASAKLLTDSDKLLNKMTKQEQDVFIQGMRNEVPMRNLPENIKRAVQVTKRDFVSAINQSIKAGVIDKKQGLKLVQRAKQKGYWPRVYNEAFLSSKEGKEKWLEVFTKQEWDEDSLRKTLVAVMGNNEKTIEKIINLSKKGEKGFYLSREQAAKLWERRGVYRKSKRSSHLEHNKKIHVKNESILDPFVIDNPHAVLTSYYHDVFRRIKMAEAFGADDSLAMKLADKVGEEFTAKEANYMRQVYYNAVGDSKADAIMSSLLMEDGLRRFYGTVNAVETLKLTLAQSINVGQALINGTTYLSGRVNPIDTYKIAYKSLIKSFKEEGQAVADESGAAMEATVLQTLGEYSEGSSILGRQVTGKFAALEYLNNPTQFLRATGFLRVEQFQRKFAANMGKAYAENLLGKKALIDSGEIIGKKADKILAQMEEIGLTSNLASDLVPEGDLLRAALRFSNEINFKNTADRLPLMWQSPHAKIFTKFKSFAFQHGAFIKENVVKPAYNGNLLPAFNYLLVGTPVGMTVDEFRRLVKGDDSELTMLKRVLRGFTSVGGLGIALDVMASSAYSATSSLANLAGPFAGDVGKLAHGAINSVSQGSVKPVVRAAVSTQVFPGKKVLMEELKTEVRRKKTTRGGARRNASRKRYSR